MPEHYKLGKKPARHGAIQFAIQQYIDITTLPKPPNVFGKYAPRYRMGLNDKLSCCVIVGAQNETIDWYHDVNKVALFTDKNVVEDYETVAGYVPGDHSTDQGTDMGEMARYRRHTGIIDAHGARHKVDAYARVPLHRLDWLKVTTWLFGGIGFGFLFPEHAMEQFDAGEPWTVVKGDDVEGGHYVPMLGFDGTYFLTTSWGRLQKMHPDFAMKYMDEVIAWLDFDRMRLHLSPEGYNEEALMADISVLTPVKEAIA